MSVGGKIKGVLTLGDPYQVLGQICTPKPWYGTLNCGLAHLKRGVMTRFRWMKTEFNATQTWRW